MWTHLHFSKNSQTLEPELVLSSSIESINSNVFMYFCFSSIILKCLLLVFLLLYALILSKDVKTEHMKGLYCWILLSKKLK